MQAPRRRCRWLSVTGGKLDGVVVDLVEHQLHEGLDLLLFFVGVVQATPEAARPIGVELLVQEGLHPAQGGQLILRMVRRFRIGKGRLVHGANEVVTTGCERSCRRICAP